MIILSIKSDKILKWVRCFLCAWHLQEENIYRNVVFFLILRLRKLHGSTIGDWPNLGVLSWNGCSTVGQLA